MVESSRPIRILGKGVTSFALKNKFPNAILYDETDFHLYDKNSDEITIVSPGIPPKNNMVLNSNNLISEYDLFENSMPFSIWISGTNGKTTTTQMCQHLLFQHGSVYGGNIGIPLSSLDKDKKIWILETSSFTLHYTQKTKPNIYILLPITQDHIYWHGSFEEYKFAKLKPLEIMDKNDIAIIPKEFKNFKTNAYVISYEQSYDLCSYFNINKEKIKFKEPFLLDSILALCCYKILTNKIDYNLINEFTIDEHKVEEFYDKKNRLWINDSKATNIDATINALIPFKNKDIHIILGGDDKGSSLINLFDNIKYLNITVYAIGKNCNKIIDYCKELNIKYYKCDFLEIAVNKIDKNMAIDSLGILSPAAASLDQFTSYVHRGNDFKKFVRNLS